MSAMKRAVIAAVLLAGLVGVVFGVGLGHNAPARAAAPSARAVHPLLTRPVPLHPAAVPQRQRRALKAPAPAACEVASPCSEHPCVELIGAQSAPVAGGVASGPVYAPTAPRPTASCQGRSSQAPRTVPVRSRPGAATVSPSAASVSQTLPVVEGTLSSESAPRTAK